MDSASLKALSLDLAPELAAAPLYIVPIPANDSFGGFCGTILEPAFRPQLVESGEWAGVGTLIAIAAGQDEESTIGVLLHELAHAVPFVAPVESDYTEPEVAHASKLLTLALSSPVPSEPPKRCGWHDERFVRSAVHLQYRAARRGVVIPFPAIVPTGQHACPPLVMLARALGDEPARLADASFAEIHSQPIPQQFLSIWSRQ